MEPRFTEGIVCLLWLGVIGLGSLGLWKYQNTAGQAGQTPTTWPPEAPISLSHTRDTLILFGHPKCPCTRATIGELNRLLVRCSGRVETHVFFMHPDEFDSEWTQTDLWRSAAAIPGVSVHEDPDGAIARQFGAKTSGTVLLFDPDGKLRFEGGITASRGHEGVNAGAGMIVAAVANKSLKLEHTPVFGCALFGACVAAESE